MVIFPAFEVKKWLLDLVEAFELDSEVPVWRVSFGWMEALTNDSEICEDGTAQCS
jgi:hypothetical protein